MAMSAVLGIGWGSMCRCGPLAGLIVVSKTDSRLQCFYPPQCPGAVIAPCEIVKQLSSAELLGSDCSVACCVDLAYSCCHSAADDARLCSSSTVYCSPKWM
jgi:hypothetical protein